MPSDSHKASSNANHIGIADLSKKMAALDFLEQRASELSNVTDGNGKLKGPGNGSGSGPVANSTDHLNDVDKLALEFAKAMPQLYKKMDEKLFSFKKHKIRAEEKEKNLHTCVTREQDGSGRFLFNDEKETDPDPDDPVLDKTPLSLYQDMTSAVGKQMEEKNRLSVSREGSIISSVVSNRSKSNSSIVSATHPSDKKHKKKKKKKSKRSSSSKDKDKDKDDNDNESIVSGSASSVASASLGSLASHSSAASDSYISYGDPQNQDVNPPLFDKYFFYSNRIMKNIGRFRPPQNGIRTLDREFSLDTLVKKNGGIPDICNAQTEHTRNYRPNWDNRSSASSFDWINPNVKKSKPHPRLLEMSKINPDDDDESECPLPLPGVKSHKKTMTRTELGDTLESSYLKGEYPRNYGHHFLHPMPSMGSRIFPERHVPYTQLFRNKVKIRKPKDFD